MTGNRERHVGSRLVATLALAAVLTVPLGGCATTSALPGHGGSSRTPTVGRDEPAADPAKVAVVRRWAADLQAGNLRGAAGFFHLPSLFDDGASDTFPIHTLAQAEAANLTLTCGAAVISAFRTGRFIDVLFRLTARAGTGGGKKACGTGIGLTARTDFLIRDGQIVEWLRAPSLPGDPGVPGTPTTPRSGKGGAGTTTSGTGASGGLPV
jgi:hypothetical protein